MKAWPIPFDEERRLEVLPGYDLFGSPQEREYDTITAMVAGLLDMPICLITIVGSEAQWIKSRHGLDLQATPREVSFCAHTILSDDPLVIRDTHRDARFRSNALVTAEPNIRFYAGAPIKTADGARLGALCVLDDRPHASTNANVLTRMAEFTAELFDKRRRDLNRSPAPYEGSRLPGQRSPSALGAVRKLMAGRRALNRQFGPSLFSDPAMVILLQLFEAQEEARSCTISALSKTGEIPFSSTQRWVARLAEQDLVRVETDPADHRAVSIEITELGRETVNAWLAS